MMPDEPRDPSKKPESKEPLAPLSDEQLDKVSGGKNDAVKSPPPPKPPASGN